MATGGGLFDIRDASAFFGIISRTLDSYLATRTKKPEDLLLLILGLAHLREWIAPNFKRGATPSNNAERFATMLYENHDYRTILLLANHAKHQRRTALPEVQTRSSVETMDERDTPIDTWVDFDEGPASSYLYGGRDLADVFSAVMTFYRDHWFSLPISHRWA